MNIKLDAYKDDGKTPWPWRLITIAAIIAVIIGILFYYLTLGYVIGQAEKNIQDLLLSHKGLHHYIQQNTHPALYSLKELGEIKNEFYSPEILSSTYMVRNVHRYYNEERTNAGLAEIYYKMAATNPRNPLNKANVMEQQLEMFNQKRNEKKYREIIEINGQKYLYYALPFLENNRACLTCHGDRRAAPAQLQAIYKGDGGFNEKIGDIRAIESIRVPLENEFKTVYMILIISISGLGALMLMLFIGGRLNIKVKLRTADLEQEILERKQTEEKLKESQQEIKKHLDHLEELVAERTAKLSEANKELEDFVYSVSHDLRAPLRSISGFAEIIDRRYKSSLNEEGQHYFDNIIKAGRQMGELIDDLLKFSRLGRNSIKIELVPLDDVLKPAIETLSDQIRMTGAQVNLPEQMPIIQGDLRLVIHIFINLFENAIKYHKPNNPPIVDIDVKVEDQHVVVSVADNGIGIAPEYHEKIFNIFQRLHSQAEYPGTGIGLAAVKKALQIMGGEVRVESEPGKGSVFRIKFLNDTTAFRRR